MFLLGLTGSIGMGKSTASAGFRCFGIAVFDSDAAVHGLLASGGAAVAAVDAAFPGCRKGDGIDRAALGRGVFGDPARLARLEAILHPLVRRAQRRFLARCCAAGRRLVVLDIPLLYETGGERLVDAVAVVSASAGVQARRVLRRPGMSASRLEAILRRQLPDADKRRRADFVIRTDLDLRRAKAQIARVIDAARARPARAWPRRWPLIA
ncbi:MAG TPA: dephospho-CoA kinase [Geminicoccaceae bacterium]|nr:dephospho-CoA kinase [Geminicoccaceae bacterium]